MSADDDLEFETRPSGHRLLALWLVVASAVGLVAAGALVLEKISYWEQKANGGTPSLTCDINPIVGCGPVINKPEGALFFHLPNPVLGLVLWSLLLAFGVLLAGRTPMPRWAWACVQLGVLFGIGLVTYLQSESIGELHVLCPWCMVTWAVTIPTFWAVTARNLRSLAPGNRAARFVSEWWVLFLALHFIVLLAAIWFTFGTTLWA